MKKNKYFSNLEWEEDSSDSLGLPRPYKIVPKEFWNHRETGIKLIKNFFLHKKIPIPWQSKPVLDTKLKKVFEVIEENEQDVYRSNRCSYCGVIFSSTEICIRWVGNNSSGIPNDQQGPRVFSDTHPLHIECMKQARIFCPYMRTRQDFEFQTGTFNSLRIFADQYKNMFKE